MFVKYGSFTHPLGEAAVSIDRETLFTEAGTPWAVRERWDIQGVISNTTINRAGDSIPSGVPADLSPKINALELAYSQNNQDIALLLPDGETPTSHRIISAHTLGGVQVVQAPCYPEGIEAEYVTYRSFTVAVEALRPLSSPTKLLSFTETMTYEGGGPRYGHLEPLVGRPIKQTLKRFTIYRVTQQGHAVGLYAYPPIPKPLWPAAQVRNRRIEKGSPRRRGGSVITDTEFPISWVYEYESAFSLIGGPHLWTV